LGSWFCETDERNRDERTSGPDQTKGVPTRMKLGFIIEAPSGKDDMAAISKRIVIL
jgi:hypothetical protein